jgi:hypothetical protein
MTDVQAAAGPPPRSPGEILAAVLGLAAAVALAYMAIDVIRDRGKETEETDERSP